MRARLIVANRDVFLANRLVNERQARYDQIGRPSGVLTQGDFDAAWFSLDATAGAVRHAVGQRIDAEMIAEQIRSEWVEARSKTEILERLRERAHEEWQVEAGRDEDRTTDDLVVGRHHLRHGSRTVRPTVTMETKS